MKHIKSIIAAALTMFVALAVSVTAFAAGTGSITITPPENAPETVTYKVYKVFDADGNGTNISYKLVEGKTTAPAGFKVDEAGNVTYAGTGTDELTEADIAAIAAYVTESDLVATVKSENGAAAVAEGLPNGFYYITTTTGSAVTIDSTNPNATVNDKNVIPTVVKSAGTEYDEDSLKAIAAVGTDQPFTAVVSTGHGATSVVFTDTMTGMTYNGDAKVTVGGTEVAASANTFAISGAKGDASFTITFVDSYIASLADNTAITINYSGLVTSDALSVNPAKNKATIKSGEDNEVNSTEVEVYNAKISVNKVDGDKKPLPGAKFKLKNADGLYYAGSTTDGTANWTKDGVEVEAVEVTAEDGTKSYTAEFKGLKDGTYTLEESTVPAGYNKAADSTVTIAANDYTSANLEQTSTVENKSGTELPSTGGMGTTLFYVIGGIMVAGAAIALIAKSRVAKIEQ